MSDSEGEANEKQVKVVLVGDGSAGKVNDLNKILFFLFIIKSF
jgi:GTPase SAR1 family protein